MTAKQQEFINTYKAYQEQYGADNVYIRYGSPATGYCFICHKAGEERCDIIEKKISGRIATTLQNNGYIKIYDKFHNLMNNANDLNYSTSNCLVGGRIIV